MMRHAPHLRVIFKTNSHIWRVPRSNCNLEGTTSASKKFLTLFPASIFELFLVLGCVRGPIVGPGGPFSLPFQFGT